MMPTTGPVLIAQERARQVCEENYTTEHDDLYIDKELPTAAVAYLKDYISEGGIPDWWPWHQRHWKPDRKNETRIQNLVKAGALIAAELDRLLRRTT